MIGGVAHFPSNFQLLELIEHIRERTGAPTSTTDQQPPVAAEAPPLNPPVGSQAPPSGQIPLQYPPVTGQTAATHPPAAAQAASLYPQIAGQTLTQYPMPMPQPNIGQAPPTYPQAPPTYPQAPPTNPQAPPPRSGPPGKAPPPKPAPPIQRTLHINPADHTVPVTHNVKRALVVFGRRGNNLTDFTTPVGLANYADRYIVVSDERGNRVLVFGLEGQIQSMFTCHGLVQGIAYDPQGDILVANPKTGRALGKSFTLQGQTKLTIGNQFTHEKPHGMAATRTNIAISSLETNKVFLFDPSGRLIRELGGTGSRKMQLRSPYYLTLNSMNDVIVSDSGNHAIKVFAAGSGKHKLTIGGQKGSAPGELSGPLGVAVDRDNNIVVCDAGNRRIQVFNSRGKFLGVVAEQIYGDGGGSDSAVPRDLAVFGNAGKLAVLVCGGDTCEIRVYPYSANNKEECVCM